MKYKKATISSAVCAAIILGTAVTVFAKGDSGNNNNVTIQKVLMLPAMKIQKNQITSMVLLVKKISKNMKNMVCHMMKALATLCIMVK